MSEIRETDAYGFSLLFGILKTGKATPYAVRELDLGRNMSLASRDMVQFTRKKEDARFTACSKIRLEVSYDQCARPVPNQNVIQEAT